MASDRQLERLIDHKLERMFVASVPTFATDATANRLVDMVDAEDFYDQEARAYWRCVGELTAERGWMMLEHLLKRAGKTLPQWDHFRAGLDPISVRDELYRHAEAIADMAAKRRLLLIGRGLVSQVEADLPPDDIVRTTQDRLLEIRSIVPDVPFPRTLRQVMEETTERRFNWAVPNWIEFKDRIMLTGREGGGKMTLLRQISEQLCVGFHPWTGEEFEPLIGLQFDLQDGKARNEREFAIIAERAGIDPFDHLYIESRDSGLNVVRSVADRRWIEAIIKKVRPHFVVLGPIYQMVIGEDATDATAMQLLIDFINLMRQKYDIIWFLEAHSPKAAMGRNRQWEPFGSQRFMAWPDAGYGIMPDSKNPQRAAFKDWRGNRDLLSKVWPQKLAWGEYWPWVPATVAGPRLRHRAKVIQIPVSDDDPGGQDEKEPF